MGGKKLVGSAQRVVQGGFVQHGSIPLQPQKALLERLFGAAAHGVEAQMTDLESLGVWKQRTPQAFEEDLIRAFESVFQITFKPFPVTSHDEIALEERQRRYPLFAANAPAPPLQPFEVGT